MSNPVDVLISQHSSQPYQLVQVKTKEGNFNVKAAQWNQHQATVKSVVIQPATSVSSTWSTNPIEFEIPRTSIHRLNDFDIRVRLTTDSTGCVLVPSPYWIDYIDFQLSPSAIIRKYGVDLANDIQQTLTQNEYNILSRAMNFSSTYTHNNLPGANASNLDLYIPLGRFCWMKQAGALFLPGLNQNIRIKVVFKQFSDVAVSGASNNLTVNNVILHCRGEELDAQTYQYEVNKWANNKVYIKYLDTILFEKNVGAETSGNQYSQTLSGITGNCAYVNFFFRDASSLAGTKNYDYRPITQFDILNGAGSSVIGGTPVLDSENRFVVYPTVFDTTYPLNQEVYFYSFSLDPKHNYESASVSGLHRFDNNHVLRYVANDTASHYLSVMAKVYGAIVVEKGNITLERSV